MSGVEQQAHLGPGGVHESVDVRFALHDRTHVVVVREAYAFCGGRAGQVRHAPAEGAPIGGAQPWPLAEWPVAVAVYRTAGFRKHQHRAADRFQQIEMRTQLRELCGGVS